jgi:hypothetical protein
VVKLTDYSMAAQDFPLKKLEAAIQYLLNDTPRWFARCVFVVQKLSLSLRHNLLLVMPEFAVWRIDMKTIALQIKTLLQGFFPLAALSPHSNCQIGLALPD